jgi:hypothetical protein
VKSWTSAIRGYFEEKNKVWVTGDCESLLKAAHVARHAKWGKELTAAIEAKARSMQQRRSRLLRAHSKISVFPDDGFTSSSVQRARIDERVTWVYRDGYDFGVESRIIQHQQKWVLRNGVWMLAHAEESSESRSGQRDLADPEGADAQPDGFRIPEREKCVPYDRVKALRYAELWWDGYNPAFPKVNPDCTNFVSQCLFAGQMPMSGGGSRAIGWWCRFAQSKSAKSWSYSWVTSHGLYSHLVNKAGATVIDEPKDLKIGDVIFYDWEGRGRFHHSTVVTDFDGAGDPLVNAHTDASYHRHFRYYDSRAWTPRTRYAFVHIPDVFC